MRRVRRASLFLLIVFAASLVPWAPSQAQPRQAQDGRTPPPPVPETRTAPRELESHLPSLYFDIAVNPDTVALGETATISLTVTNQASDPAQSLVVTLPRPDGTVPEQGAGLVSADKGWRWEQTQLAANSSATFTASVRLNELPPGNALLVKPEATARGLEQPVRHVGGVLVLDRAKKHADGAYIPGQAAKLQSADGTVEVQVPATASNQKLALRHAREPKAGEKAPPAVAGTKRGFPAFFLHATTAAGQDVHQFAAPLTLAVRYTPQQLAALGIAEADLRIFWYDEQAEGTRPDGSRWQGDWVPIHTAVDPATHTATASVDHFSGFKLGDGSSPSKAFIPDLQGWQVGLYGGSGQYSHPIVVPPGPNGIAPELALTYTSNALDGNTGMRLAHQSSWVGRGWTLDVPSVALKRVVGNETTVASHFHYVLTVDGKTSYLVRGAERVAGANPWNPTQWNWHLQNESYLRVEVMQDPAQLTWTKGTMNGVAPPRYIWKVWDTDGSRYEFTNDLWQGWNYCGTTRDDVVLEQYKWLITREVDPYGNTINYSYGRSQYVGDTWRCNSGRTGQGTVDLDAWPTAITWGGNATTPDRFKVEFVSGARTGDTQFDSAANQFWGSNGAPRETRRLDSIRVLSNPGTAYQLIREYDPNYEHRLLPDTLTPTGTGTCSWASDAYAKLTLMNLTERGSDGVAVLPTTTFTHGLLTRYDIKNNACFPNGSWSRLEKVNNGYGGSLVFEYENIGWALGGNVAFRNHRRVTAKVVNDGRGQDARWTYQYQNPALNTLGKTLNPSDTSGLTNPNSAALYFNKYWNQNVDHSKYLVTPALEEFRGHNYVKEIAPDGAQTEHWFFQGDGGCVPTTKGTGQVGDHAAIEADACYQKIRTSEFLRGQEYRTRALRGDGRMVEEREHQFQVEYLGAGSQALGGVWRSWTAPKQTTESIAEGSDPTTTVPKQKTTYYQYDITNNTNTNGKVYGNLARVDEYDNGTRIRITMHFYAVRDEVGGTYSTERKWATTTFDTNWVGIARDFFFYDGATDPRVMGAKGQLTRQSHLYDPTRSDVPTTNVSSQDTTYSYDAWGNRTGETTYAQPGTANYANSVWTFSAPGNNSTATTSTTTYEGIFRTYATQTDEPVGDGTVLTERAEYDWRGLMTKVVDENGQVSEAVYDAFGRQTKLIKPGDSANLPTVKIDYHNTKRPVQIVVSQRETSGSDGAFRPVQHFYDGIGREIQTKKESADGTQNIVTDTDYDGLGRVRRTSQARYVTTAAGSTTFWDLAPRVADADMRWMTTTYDALGRALDTTLPNGTASGAITQTRYWLSDVGNAVSVTDANGHQTRREYDTFDRLRRVIEYSGNGGTDGAYAEYASTTYNYDMLDRLVEVQDAKGNVTSIEYDGLGRKRAMRDPDMGVWSYQYDVGGNLTAQTDAKNQTLRFTYDAVDRLLSRIYPDGTKAEYRYDEAASTNGKGQRTSITNATGTTRWQYDARGRTVKEEYSVAGMSGTRIFQWTHDAADRVATMTYPSAETVTYSYDPAWRQTSVCSSLGPCYAKDAVYTALDQPNGWTLGNGIQSRWTYDSMQRLQRIQVGTGNLFDRTYTYDTVGNVASTNDALNGQTQNFTYDHLNRLTRAWTTGGSSGTYDESYSYDTIDNMVRKGGSTLTYASSTQPHTLNSADSTTYSYDTNGNLGTSSSGRSYTWNVDNQLASVTQSGTELERYTYDAYGERITKTASGKTTVYLRDVWEEDLSTGTTRTSYTLVGQTIAQRTRATGSNLVYYLHADHLGSITLVSGEDGIVLSRQEYRPWGEVRSGDISQTSLGFTGQHRDNSGLLHYHARYYDPTLGQFLSADTLVPGTDALTIAPNDPTLRNVGSIEANSDPQALNRYAYVLNNPVNHTDPSGHSTSACGWISNYTLRCTVWYNGAETRAMANSLGSWNAITMWVNAGLSNLYWALDQAQHRYAQAAKAVVRGLGLVTAIAGFLILTPVAAYMRYMTGQGYRLAWYIHLHKGRLQGGADWSYSFWFTSGWSYYYY